MPQLPDNPTVVRSVRLYERLLAIYPAKFRAEFGPAMVQLFRDQCRDAWNHSRGKGMALLWLRVLKDLVKTSLKEHMTRSDASSRVVFLRVFVAVFACACVFSVCETFWTGRIYSSTATVEVESDLPPNKPTSSRPR